MATTATLPWSLFLLFSIAQLFSLYFPTAHTISAPKPRRLMAKLIHRNSVLSPYYNPNATVWELNQEALNRSRARVRYIQERMTSLRNKVELLDNGALSLGVVAGNAGFSFLAKVSIGEPPVPQLLTVDTGSSLLWVQCAPCDGCVGQAAPVYDPTKSSTFAAIPCTPWSQICADSSGICWHGNCTFTKTYGDGTTVSGNIASERLLFETTDDGMAPVDINAFGCATTKTGSPDNQENGLLGLGPDNFSILKHLGGKFSHCFGDISDPEYEYNILIFGQGAILEGDVTPMDVDLYHHCYYVNLEGISVGEEKLDIDPSIFKIGKLRERGAFIDSGTTFTIVAKEGYDPLRSKVKSLLDEFLQRALVLPLPELLCYAGHVDRDLTGFPAVSFHLAGGADIVLDTHSMFLQVREDVLCMAVEPSDDNIMDVTIIGNLALQSYNVGYDIDAGKMYIRRTDCQVFQS